MLDLKTIEKLGGLEGCRVSATRRGGMVTISLKPSARAMCCEHCGHRCRQVYEATVR